MFRLFRMVRSQDRYGSALTMFDDGAYSLLVLPFNCAVLIDSCVHHRSLLCAEGYPRNRPLRGSHHLVDRQLSLLLG